MLIFYTHGGSVVGVGLVEEPIQTNGKNRLLRKCLTIDYGAVSDGN